jgi:uncharacterized membrane protein
MKKIVAIMGSVVVIVFAVIGIFFIQLNNNQMIWLFIKLMLFAALIFSILFLLYCVVEAIEKNKSQPPTYKKENQPPGFRCPYYKGKNPGLRKKISLLLLYAEDLAREKYLYFTNRAKRGLEWR